MHGITNGGMIGVAGRERDREWEQSCEYIGTGSWDAGAGICLQKDGNTRRCAKKHIQADVCPEGRCSLSMLGKTAGGKGGTKPASVTPPFFSLLKSDPVFQPMVYIQPPIQRPKMFWLERNIKLSAGERIGFLQLDLL